MFLKEAFRVQRKINTFLEYCTGCESIVDILQEKNYIRTYVIHKKSELNNFLPNDNYGFKDEEKEIPQDKRRSPDYKTVIKTINKLIDLKVYLSTQIEKAKTTIAIKNEFPYDTAIMKANFLRNIINNTENFRDESEKSFESKESVTLMTKDGSVSLSYPTETKIIPNVEAFKAFKEMKDDFKAEAEELSSLIEASTFSTKVEISEDKQKFIDKVMKANTFVELL